MYVWFMRLINLWDTWDDWSKMHKIKIWGLDWEGFYKVGPKPKILIHKNAKLSMKLKNVSWCNEQISKHLTNQYCTK